MREEIIRLKNVSAKILLGNGQELEIVKNVSLLIESGESYAVVGKSGSGKTSLVSIIGLLNRKYKGTYLYLGKEIASASDREISLLRARNFGFVFQNYSLIPHLTVNENISLALEYSGVLRSRREIKKRCLEVLQWVGLAQRQNDYPNRLSGGEQQRVAIARALASSPKVLICDEPTGALDIETSHSVMNLLLDLVAKNNVALILVTHDLDIAKMCNHSFQIDCGEIIDVPNAI